MKARNTVSILFGILAGMLSHLMCIHVTYSYCSLRWNNAILNSASPSVALLFLIPYAIGISVCTVLCIVFRNLAGKKADKS